MKYYKYIFLTAIVALLPVISDAQYINIVCPGDTGHIYRVEGSEGSTFVWTLNGGTITDNYGDSVKVNWGLHTGEFEIRVQEFSKYNCPSVPVSGMVKILSPSIDLGEDIEMCEGESFIIPAPDNFSSYLWHDGSTHPYYIASKQELVSVQATDQYGCKASDNLYVTVHPLPEVNLGEDVFLCGTESMILDAGRDGLEFIWSTGETTREITVYQGEKTIWVRAKDNYECENSDTIRTLRCATAEYFSDMPTAFTPNDDGINDVWRIPKLQAFPGAVVEIFDRWGNLIFRSEPGYSTPWDGTLRGRKLPMDAYYFVIRLNSEDLEPLLGTVTLIR